MSFYETWEDEIDACEKKFADEASGNFSIKRTLRYVNKFVGDRLYDGIGVAVRRKAVDGSVVIFLEDNTEDNLTKWIRFSKEESEELAGNILKQGTGGDSWNENNMYVHKQLGENNEQQA
jgi:hypothetical protein